MADEAGVADESNSFYIADFLWHDRSGAARALILVVGFIVALSLLAAIAGGGDSGKASTAAAAADGEGGGDIHLVAERSSCVPNPYDAKILFLITVQNTSSEQKSLELTPVRRYSDGSTNDSIMDQLKMTVAAGATQGFHADFDYNAEKHSVLECWLQRNDGTRTPISVVS